MYPVENRTLSAGYCSPKRTRKDSQPFSTIRWKLSIWQEDVMLDEVGEKPPRTKEERRKRQKKLEQARRRRQTENAPAAPAPAETEVGTEPGEPPAKRRGRPKRRPITASDLQGLKCFENLAPLLERLHDVGCERDQAGNREFHYDELCLLLLLALFNPVVDSLRGLQQASELESLQERLGVGRVSHGFAV
jgi:hypothetical protein